MKFAVVTPTGNIGSSVVKNLLDAGVEVVLLEREPNKVAIEVRNRVRVEQGVLGDAGFVQRATQGVDALFWLTPYSLTEADQNGRYQKLFASASGAVTNNHIPYVVNLSSFGAQKRQGAGFASYVGQMEDCLNATGANILHLRPGFFMENFLIVVSFLRDQGIIPLPIPGATTLPMTATSDIGVFAAKQLLKCDWQGQTIKGIHGPQDLSLDEAATILSEVTEKPLHYMEAPWDMFRDALKGMKATEEGIRCDVELMKAFAEPGIVAEPRMDETTVPTTLAEWGRTVLKPKLA